MYSGLKAKRDLLWKLGQELVDLEERYHKRQRKLLAEYQSDLKELDADLAKNEAKNKLLLQLQSSYRLEGVLDSFLDFPALWDLARESVIAFCPSPVWAKQNDALPRSITQRVFSEDSRFVDEDHPDYNATYTMNFPGEWSYQRQGLVDLTSASVFAFHALVTGHKFNKQRAPMIDTYRYTMASSEDREVVIVMARTDLADRIYERMGIQ